jgi:hypothetical protein
MKTRGASVRGAPPELHPVSSLRRLSNDITADHQLSLTAEKEFS